MLVAILHADGGVQFDCSLSESHARESVVTEFPVERGASISDHVRTGPSTVTINGIVGAEPIGSSIGQPESVDRVQRAYEEILRMQDAGQVTTVYTSLKTYSDMVIRSTVVPRDAANGRILNMTITMKQIRTSTSTEVDLPTPALPRAQSTKADGKKTGEEVATPPTSLARQAARQAARFFGGDSAEKALESIATGG